MHHWTGKKLRIAITRFELNIELKRGSEKNRIGRGVKWTFKHPPLGIQAAINLFWFLNSF